ncbi:MAG TPA: DUF4124 domain-containing protein [Telluria sp.]|nr:DUF4124 domain-containing protein [Telluria sp.]
MTIARQRGALSLVWVAILSAALAAAAMAALWSMRYDRNLFAEGASAAAKAAPVRRAIDAVTAAKDGAGGPMRKCVIAGKTVISNTDCLDSNKTSKTIRIDDTRGFEAPSVPAAPAPTSDPAIDKILEKQLH